MDDPLIAEINFEEILPVFWSDNNIYVCTHANWEKYKCKYNNLE